MQWDVPLRKRGISGVPQPVMCNQDSDAGHVVGKYIDRIITGSTVRSAIFLQGPSWKTKKNRFSKNVMKSWEQLEKLVVLKRRRTRTAGNQNVNKLLVNSA